MEVQVKERNDSATLGMGNGNGKLTMAPDPEVSEKPTRRRFTAEYKQRILEEAEQAARDGSLGALLRREGLYSSHLAMWRFQRKQGEMEGLSGKKHKADPAELARQNKELLRKNKRLQKRLEKAELVIQFQKKLSEMLEIELPPYPDGEKGS